MDEAQKEMMRALATRKRAVLIGTLPIQPLFWWWVCHMLPDEPGPAAATFTGFLISAWITMVVGWPAIDPDRRHY